MPKTTRLVLLALVSACALYSATAVAADIQMLPPVNFDGTNKTPCSPGTTSGLLHWDGQTSIKCIPGTSGDAKGNLSAAPQAALKTGDGSNTTCGNGVGAGAIRYNAQTSTFEGCNGSVWGPIAASSGWVSLPRNSIYEIPNGFHVAWSDGVTGDPEEICRKAAYTTFTGGCRGIGKGVSRFDAPASFPWRGVLIATKNTNVAYGQWALSCVFGWNEDSTWKWVYADADTQILCVK